MTPRLAVVLLLIIIVAVILLLVVNLCRDDSCPEQPPKDDIDYIIVGAGVSGAYLAYRLSQMRRGMNILVVEKNCRVGGRILSAPDTRTALEYGALRYFPSFKRTARLVKTLGLTSVKSTVFSQYNYLYLKGKRYQYRNLFPAVYDQYGVPENERDGTPSEQLFKWFSTLKNPEDYAVIGQNKFSAQFMQLYWDLTGYNYMVSQQAVSGWLFDESLLTSADQLIVENGYDQIASRCLERSGARVLLNCEARRLNKYELELHMKNDVRVVRASKIIYTGQIIDYELYSRSDLRLINRIENKLQDVPGMKLFLQYDEPWWRRAGIHSGRHITDLTMNQFWVEWAPNTCMIYSAALNTIGWEGYIPEEIMNEVTSECLPITYDVMKPSVKVMFRNLLDTVDHQVRLLFGLQDDVNTTVKTISFKFWDAMYEYWKPSRTIDMDKKTLEGLDMINADYSQYQGWVEGALERVDNYIINKYA